MEKLGMSKLKEILRLRHECNLSARQISRALNISHTVVNNYLSNVLTLIKIIKNVSKNTYIKYAMFAPPLMLVCFFRNNFLEISHQCFHPFHK